LPDQSNPTSRVMDVLNFLAAHPTEAFSLAEIARHVDLSNGSAHRLLTTLAAGQFLFRNERHRTYSLGLAMVAIGQAAIEKHRGIDVARREVARLAVELDVQCSANAVVDGEILVLVKEGTSHSHLGLTRVGERRPLVPPVGLCHVAWSGEAAIDAYVARASPYLGPHVHRHLLATFPVIRQRGFAIAANGPGSARTRQTMVAPGDQVRDGAYWSRVFELVGQMSENEIQLFDISQARPQGVSYIASPVFAPDGTVAFQLVISGMPTDLGEQDVRSHAERLCASAAAITDAIHGRPPPWT
jgi:DNA-binding IclR family transcriptional regulator